MVPNGVKFETQGDHWGAFGSPKLPFGEVWGHFLAPWATTLAHWNTSQDTFWGRTLGYFGCLVGDVVRQNYSIGSRVRCCVIWDRDYTIMRCSDV